MSNATLPIINFSWNWNAKLFCHSFTTIRLHNPHKYKVGQTYSIQLNGRDMGPGKIINIAQFRLDQLTPAMAHIDMGFALEKAKSIILTMYKNKNLDFATQLFDYIVIDQPDKILLTIPTELLISQVDAENPELFTQ